jgi:GNAT superfamily N-acetyltransferase
MRAPEPLAATHDIATFDCGEPSLDEWLKRRALANQGASARRTYVVADDRLRVLGYYALAAGAVSHVEATGAVRRNMPEPIPVIVLARLAVDRSQQGRNLGSALLKDAVLRTMAVANEIGVRALLAHALNETAKAFYLRYGFAASPVDALTVMLRLPR